MMESNLSTPSATDRRGIVHVFRDHVPFIQNEQQFSYSTEPFLTPVGCGTCGNIQRLREICEEAKRKGYDVLLCEQPDYRKHRFPLRDIDAELVTSLIND